MFLEKNDLVRLTGYVHMSKQKATLDVMGVPYKMRESDNRLLVLESDVVNMMRGSQATETETPEPVQATAPPPNEPQHIPTESLPGFAVE